MSLSPHIKNDTLLDKFSEIGLKLTAEKDVSKLLALILTECMKITDSDAGSIYIKDQEEGSNHLIFTYTQNTSMSFPFNTFKLPINMNSIAGACAATGEIYNFKSMTETQSTLGFTHNKSYDESYGYETCNMLTIPLKNYTNDMIGVMQLINKKRDPNHRFTAYSKDYCNHVIPYTDQDVTIVSALASQAAMLIERSILFEDIENLLDSMIDTLVTALDRRDPITAGHSKRVSSYAMALAYAVNRVDYGTFASLNFSDEELRELRIAGMLHDVGKIGVREYVLMKRNKLSDDAMEQIRWRYKYICRLDEANAAKIIGYLNEIESINKSGFLKDEQEDFLKSIQHLSYTDPEGDIIPLLKPEEFEFLMVKRGNLTQSERKEINDHVLHTFNILSGIEWTRNLKLVPRIASDHHEKPNGQGYPEGRTIDQLELRARILAIADVFDALTAKDRPYKPAIPIDKSLDILEEEAIRRGLDPDLVTLFKEERVYEEAQP